MSAGNAEPSRSVRRPAPILRGRLEMRLEHLLTEGEIWLVCRLPNLCDAVVET
jgi:hypothetical protein